MVTTSTEMVNGQYLSNDEQKTNNEPVTNDHRWINDESAQVINEKQLNEKNTMTDNREVIQNNGTTIIERNIRGQIVTVNRLKHYAFIKRTDDIRSRDIFAREASITGQIQKPKFLVSDKCVFDIMKSSRGLEAVNIEVHKRKTSGNLKLNKIPKKKTEQAQATDASVLFRTTIIELFREATKSNK